MSDPGRTTSNPHKVAQWKARWQCAHEGHLFHTARCVRCGLRARTVTVRISPQISRFIDGLRSLSMTAQRTAGALDDFTAAYRGRGA